MTDNERVLREALAFYADPFEWKRINDPYDYVRVPDFYSETAFGDTARTALASTAAPDSAQQEGE